MIPYPYNMVDMGGIDLAEANGTVVDGLYAKIIEAVNACGDVVLYNWKFADIEIAPQHTSILLGNPIIINGAVQVTEQDEVTVPGINPDPPAPPTILPLNVDENGEYSASDFDADGFDPVNVLIPPPVISPLEATQNGTFSPPSGVDGYAPVTVNVQTPSPVISPFEATQNGTFSPPSGVDGYAPVTVNVSSGSSDVEYWDLSASLIGTLHGIVSRSRNVTMQSGGADFVASSAIRFGIGWNGMTIEIETGNLQLTAGSHRRFVMLGADNTGVGFIYRDNGKWGFYASGWVESTETDGSFFDNCLVKIHIDATGHWHIYKDGVLFWEPVSALSANYNYLVIGSTSGSIIGTIKNVRVY